MFFPQLIFAVIQSRYFKEIQSFWCLKLIGIIAGLISIPTIFYTYNGSFGKSPDWLNITIFFIATAIAFTVESKLFYNNRITCKRPKIAIITIIIIAAMFIIFTFAVPKLPLFIDPLTKTYGI